jgi:hypothetical protein
MSLKRNRSQNAPKRERLTKELLLPMDRNIASEKSLAVHLALVACREGRGNAHLINELMYAVYESWYLQRLGYGSRPPEQFKIAEYAVEATLSRAHESGEWILDPDVISDFEELISLHDFQLSRAPLHAVNRAKEQLGKFLTGSEVSPIRVAN